MDDADCRDLDAREDALEDALGGLNDRLARVVRRHESLGLELDAIQLELGELIARLARARRDQPGRSRLADRVAMGRGPELRSGERSSASGGAPRRRDGEREATLKKLAARGVTRFECARDDRGRVSARIDSGARMKLSPKLAALLLCISRGPVDGDGFVRWKSFDEIAREVDVSGAERRRRHTITELVHRLRKLLEAHGANPYTVQVKRKVGVRLALRPTERSENDDVISDSRM